MKGKKHFLFILIILVSIGVYSQEVIELTSSPNPPDIIWKNPERSSISPIFYNKIVSNVSKPTLTVFLPSPEKANGTALIIAPGGGFHTLSIDIEGDDLATWCVEQGIAAFVLRYRLVPTGDDPVNEFIKKLQSGQSQMDNEMGPVIQLAISDGLAAIEHLRINAMKYNIKPDRIGILGFSAGGTVAAAAALHYTSTLNRPDFAAPVYAALHVLNMNKLPENPTPLFIAVTADDNFGFQKQSVELFNLWNTAGNPVELHIYQEGGHGFGMRKQNLPCDTWTDNFKNWLHARGWMLR